MGHFLSSYWVSEMSEEEKEQMTIDDLEDAITMEKIQGFVFRCPGSNCRQEFKHLTFKGVKARAKQHIKQSKKHDDIELSD